MNLRMKQIREDKGLTQLEVADKLGMRLSTYRTWEQESVKITLENACRVCAVLDCSPNDLCGWYEDHPRPDVEVLTDDERELISLHRQSTPEWRHNLIQNARASALASKDAAERDTSDVRKEA